MLFRFSNVALLALAFSVFASALLGIEADQLIDPSAPAVEAEESQVMDGIFQTEGASMGMFVTILGYVVILGALSLAGWFLFKRGLLRKPFNTKEGKLKVAETRMLGNRQFIMVVEYEEQKILLGVGPGKIDYLTNLHSYRQEPFTQLDGVDASKGGGEA